MTARTARIARCSLTFTAAALCALALVAYGADAKEAILTGFDALTTPGQSADLRAKLEGARWPHFDVKGEPIEYLLNGQPIGTAITDSDGLAVFTWQPPAAGHYHITVRPAAASKCQATPDVLLVAAWKPDARILISDLDHTLADATALQFLRRDSKDIPTLPGASDALNDLAQIYRVIYLTARDEAFTRKTRAWLQMNGFPEGPVFSWDFLDAPLSHEKYKAQMIAAFKKSFSHIEAGVGDLVGDAKAYLQNGLKAIIISPGKPPEDLPKAAIDVKSWRQVLELLTAKAEEQAKRPPPDKPVGK